MPKRSNRSNKTSEPNDANLTKPVETFLSSRDMKKTLADALKEPKSKKDKNKNNKKVVNSLKSSKKVLGESREQPEEPCKLEFANAVRNCIGKPDDKSDKAKAVMSQRTREVVANKCDVIKEITEEVLENKRDVIKERTGEVLENKCDVIKERTGVVDDSDELKDIEIVQEFDDDTWEVVSCSDCSQADDEDDLFHMVDSEDLSLIADSEATEKSDVNKENVQKSDTKSEKRKPDAKKKTIVMRKYVGGEEFRKSLSSLGLEYSTKMIKQEKCEVWCGRFKDSYVEVEAMNKFGVTMTAVKVKSDSASMALTCLQTLAKEADLRSIDQSFMKERINKIAS